MNPPNLYVAASRTSPTTVVAPPFPALAAARAQLLAGERVVVTTRWADAQRIFVLTASTNEPLSSRERLVAQRLGAGAAPKEIAFDLATSLSTVARVGTRVAQRLGLTTRVDLAMLMAALDPESGRARVTAIEHEVDGRMVVAVSLRQSAGWQRLSRAERSVATLALAGHRAQDIAHLRGDRSARTIANQLGRVFRKLGVSGRAELASRLALG